MPSPYPDNVPPLSAGGKSQMDGDGDSGRASGSGGGKPATSGSQSPILTDADNQSYIGSYDSQYDDYEDESRKNSKIDGTGGDEEEEKGSSGSKKCIISILITLVLVGLVAGLTVFLVTSLGSMEQLPVETQQGDKGGGGGAKGGGAEKSPTAAPLKGEDKQDSTSTQAPDKSQESYEYDDTTTTEPPIREVVRDLPDYGEEDMFAQIDSNIVVDTHVGPIKGTVNEHQGRKIYTYTSIPYAAPPIGSLRFRKPVDPKPWKEPLETTGKPPICVNFNPDMVMGLQDKMKVPEGMEGQIEKGQEHGMKVMDAFRDVKTDLMPEIETGQEDCLYMNVYAPEFKKGDKLKPVIVFIHDGFFFIGGITKPIYDGGTMAAVGDVVFVMMNWRLNVFGFLSSGHEEVPGNMGLWDQHHVLRWVRQNIMNFGGHPGKVTLLGHGGGAWSAGYHVLSPVSQIMFRRSIMLSGSPYALITMMASRANNPTIFYKLCKQWGCPADGTEKAPKFSKETFECVRKMDVGKLIEGLALHAQGQQDPGVYPTEDGEFFDMHPFESIEKGRFGPQTQVLIGSGLHEGALMAMLMLPEEYHPQGEAKNLTVSDLMAIGKQRAPPQAAQYMNMGVNIMFSKMDKKDPIAVRNRLVQYIGDGAIVCPNLFFVEAFIKKPEHKAYYYRFDHRPSTTPWAKWAGGGLHYDDVQFVFGKPVAHPDLYTPEEVKFSETWIKMLAKFADTGDPAMDGIEWPPCQDNKMTYVTVNNGKFEVHPGFFDNQCKGYITQGYKMGRVMLKSRMG